MKKTFTTALAAMMLMSAGTAMAASFPNFDFNGDIKAHYRWNTADGAANQDGGKFTLRLNAQSDLSKDVQVYARFVAQGLTNDLVGADFNTAAYNQDSAVTFDRFGFIVKGKDFNYNIGRQALSLGQGLLIDNTGYIGVDKGYFHGLTITGKSGITNLKIVAGENWDVSTDKTKVYAVDASYSPTKDWTLGGVVSKLDNPNSNADVNYWAANAAYNYGKATFFGEYGKSNLTTDNKGYALGTSYAFDSKDSAYAIYSRVEAKATMDSWNGSWRTTYDDGGKGIYLGFTHKLTKDATVDLFYKNMKEISTDTGYTSFRTTVTYKF